MSEEMFKAIVYIIAILLIWLISGNLFNFCNGIVIGILIYDTIENFRKI